MMWLTWRQARLQTLATAALLAAFAILLLATGPHLVTLYRDSSFAACHANCSQYASNFLNQLATGSVYHLIYLLGALLIVLLPVVIGLFWGAPLIAREVESGSYRLAWNQSVTRERWLAVKLGVLGLTSMALAGLFSLALSWWASPIDHAAAVGASGGFQQRFFPTLFGARGVVPIGYAAFAFALGVLIGLLIKRTIPAMAVTLAVTAAVLIAMPLGIRPHLITPVRTTTALTAANIQGLSASPGPGGVQLQTVFAGSPDLPGAWVLSTQVTTASGSANLGRMPVACQPPNSGGPQACFSALAAKHLKRVVTYQPADRYWDFQWLELGIFLTVAILLAWGCFWLIRRRLN
ncbi:MAG TPA: ABC transporter permease [Streptosporangiaceae bacterium]|jgi:ABC-type transport system involved in multi-copper enzyme maturation permease subunit|nr:ABC transporter permease [Streptosporangiaceae bacterium]